MDRNDDNDDDDTADQDETLATEYFHEYCSQNILYPLRGRPFGIAFIWSNVYVESRGNASLNISEDRFFSLTYNYYDYVRE